MLVDELDARVTETELRPGAAETQECESMLCSTICDEGQRSEPHDHRPAWGGAGWLAD
ncbi:hypothetical protein [Streptomyces sp. NRRL S-118]|uniref:hypothetical protein n=1 Tax=Streptomyces sp. NRRL S-118 TaxID=1463881 RepID=UPI000ADADB88|nr:hypothetical protein [Streptomyces sp. NRRL S-118]